jgi:hypothetical protein
LFYVEELLVEAGQGERRSDAPGWAILGAAIVGPDKADIETERKPVRRKHITVGERAQLFKERHPDARLR